MKINKYIKDDTPSGIMELILKALLGIIIALCMILFLKECIIYIYDKPIHHILMAY